MKNLLIIYPHWPPSNLAGVHRPRLIANFLPEFDWHPIVLTVNHQYYEEEPDWEICKTVKEHIEVIEVKAFTPPQRIRIIGDIGLRAFPFLYKKAKEIVRSRKIDAIWIPVPNYYSMLLGRLLYRKFKIPYGIDYIDPWSDGIPGADKLFSRAWLSNRLANFLEPIALKKTAFITGVNESYYQYIFDRRWVKSNLPNIGMPYGFDPEDHENVAEVMLPWTKEPGTFDLLYAGAFLPKSSYFLELLFRSIKDLKESGVNFRFIFLGTGSYSGKSIKEYAEEYGIASQVIEERKRFPFLHILYFLSQTSACLLLGSTEVHYTASKTFQMLLSGNPIFSILHQGSSAAQFLHDAKADQFLVNWNETLDDLSIIDEIKEKIISIKDNDHWSPDLNVVNQFSSVHSAKKLTEVLEVVKG